MSPKRKEGSSPHHLPPILSPPASRRRPEQLPFLFVQRRRPERGARPVPRGHPPVPGPYSSQGVPGTAPDQETGRAPYVEIESGSYRSRLTAAAAAATATLPTCPGRTDGRTEPFSVSSSFSLSLARRTALGRGAAPRTPPCALPIYTPLSPLYATLPSPGYSFLHFIV